jgi:hypothetical protein
MAKRPTSRFETIFRQELNSGKGAISSLGTAISQSQKEKRDVRNILPKSGILGAILEKQFGKSYKYAGPKGPSIQSKSATAQAASSRIMARNSMFLPIIAKDMNIMRQNIQQIARKQGIKPKTKENYGKSLTTESNPSVAPSASGPAAKSGMFGGITDTLGSIGGGVLGLGGAIISGLLGAIGSIGGTFLSGLTAMTGFGLPGIISLIAGGYVIYSLAKSINFKKIGTDLYSVFGDAFDGISKSLKEFFGIKEDETFMKGFARKLDEAFNTSFFTTSLNKASKSLEETTNLIGTNVKGAFNTILAHGLAAAKTLGDVMTAVGKDIIGYTRRWMDQQQDTVYMLIGAAIGGVIGSSLGVGAVVGAAIGALAGKKYGQYNQAEDKRLAEHYEKNFGGKEGAAKQLEAQITMGSQMIDTNLGKDDDAALDMSNKNSRKWLASYLSLRTGGKTTPEEMEKDIVYDLQYHGGNKYKGWTVSKVKEEVSSYERALRKVNPEKGISNLAKFDFKKVYADNFESSKSTVSELTSSDDGKGKGSDQFAKFPSAEAGFKAQRALWEKPFYSKKTIAEALKSWAPDATENYGKGIEKAIGVSIASTKFSDLSEAQKVALLNEQARQEGFFKPGSLPNRMNNPGAMKFASWETAYGAEPSGVGEGGKKVGSSQQLASNSKSAPSQENTTPKNQPGLNKYEKMSETELILSMFGDMFGDLSTSLFQLADASTKSSQKNGNSGDRIISDTVYNYDLIATEEGLRRVARGSN